MLGGVPIGADRDPIQIKGLFLIRAGSHFSADLHTKGEIAKFESTPGKTERGFCARCAIIRHDYTALTYYGVTSRHWLKRLKEHVASATTGSPLLFHRALREELRTAARFQHTIIGAGLTKGEAYDVEEYLVDKYSLAPNFKNGLNMLPGGYEGLRRLHEIGLLAEGMDIEPEEREGLLERYAREHPRLGVANPLISERWKDDAYAEAVICGRDNRLTAQQVRHIRMLAALGHTADDITALSGASNESQVRRVIENRTYARIR